MKKITAHFGDKTDDPSKYMAFNVTTNGEIKVIFDYRDQGNPKVYKRSSPKNQSGIQSREDAPKNVGDDINDNLEIESRQDVFRDFEYYNGLCKNEDRRKTFEYRLKQSVLGDVGTILDFPRSDRAVK